MYTVIKGVGADFISYFNPTTKRGAIRLGVVGVFAIGSLAVASYVSEEAGLTDEPADTRPVVSLLSAADTASVASIEVVGTVRADAEVEVLAEANGRLTSLNISLGDTVTAGTVLARVENSTQAAALLQAEGAYEAAQASAAIADVSVVEARRAVDRAVADGSTTLATIASELQSIFTNQLDEIFADPNNVYRVPGLISQEDAPRLNTLRASYRSVENTLPELQRAAATIDSAPDVESVADDVRAVVNTYRTVIDTVRALIEDGSERDQFDAATSAMLASLITIEQQLTGITGRLINIDNTISSANDALERAQLNSQEQTVSTADAQLKQALGSLRSAQAAFNKTVITAPIAGAVAALPVELGQVVSNGQLVTTITNDNAFEVAIFLTPSQATQLSIGDEVTIENESGIVQAIAPSIAAGTGKIEVRITSTGAQLVSGESVTVIVPLRGETDSEMTETQSVPLTAIKFRNNTASVLTVNSDNRLEAHEVVLGRPQGGNVHVLSGLEGRTIVEDVRGLVAGQEVRIR